MKRTFSKGVVLGAIVAVLITSGMVAVAATTPFNLNTTGNTVSAPTGASGSIAGNLFTITDKSTAGGAPLSLVNHSTATGSTALRLTVKSGKAPFTINSGAKVTNLNADRLDGVDSTGFVQGDGHLYTNAVAITRPVGRKATTYTPKPPVAPRFFNVQFYCPGTTGSLAPTITITDLTSSGLNVSARNDANADAFVDGSIGGISFPTDPSGDLTTATVNGLPGGTQTSSTITIATQEQSGDCYFQIQALTGS